MEIVKKLIGNNEGKDLFLFEFINKNGVKIGVLNHGATLTSVVVPDKNGYFEEVCLGFDNPLQYLQPHPSFGTVCGRYANRIAKGQFQLEGKSYQLPINNGPNSLHGGIKGFDKRTWDIVRLINEEDRAGVELTYTSVNGEEAYPGELKVTVYYYLTNKNEVLIEYFAMAESTTILNLTNHAYFNLMACKENIYSHVLHIDADQYTETDETSIPTGKILKVEGTALDFRKPKAIGKDIASWSNGYDNNLVLNKKPGEYALSATVTCPANGRQLKVFTTEPGIQLYTANFLDGSLIGYLGKRYEQHDGFCLETQHFPDSPNHPDFPSTVLKPGEMYYQKTIFQFSVEK